jgi:hypothetical protein
MGGQLLGGFNAEHGGAAIGLSVDDGEGLLISGLKIMDHRRPVVLERCRNSYIHGSIANPGTGVDGAAAQLTDCQGLDITLAIFGKPRAFDRGIDIEGTAERLKIDATMIDLGAVSGASGSARVVFRGAVTAVPDRHPGVSVEGA